MAFESLSEKLNAAFKKLRGKGRLHEADVKEAMREVRLALLEADVSYKVVKDFINTISARAVGADVLESLSPAQMVIKIVNEELVRLMGSTNAKLQISSKPPTVVMLVGLQGAGKTTNGAKLAALMRKTQGKRPLLVACDIYRPAAIKQLETVGAQLDIPVFQMGTANPVDIAKAAIAHANKHGNDMVFLDTAGRLHIDEALMEELKNIKAAVDPAEILLVVDAMTGQDAVNAATAFNDALGIDGIMLTKLDGDARGGAALSVRAITGKPVKFAGTGEKLDQIEVFHPDRMASRILGMGDVLTLIEKAEQNFDEKKAREMAEKLSKNRFTLTDYYEQLTQLKSMGSLSDIAGMLPGVDAKALAGASVDEKAIGKTEAIILSMTRQERENPTVLNSSRKKRIAAGSGTQVVDINRLLKQFETMQALTKQMSKGKMPAMLGGGKMGRNLGGMKNPKGKKGLFGF
ncbi:signal recognition particle subunit FFH/SRP54 (srp54) [Sporobacter termitidis DSM 10068]|uniref:Signal recognition particle protein n=1 Tax=Sporobacter termitidis DSM 10068 TaxID=1123282 RepID=A0A1M5TQW2_9FIRM|nr:signal recognition particle protein [Sporobacter termitidis]SHH53215.1 signal recognition particle subunit FFH/SRP54 (srp54) [Sporobacter termitidis DSM 10068]